MIGDNYPSSPNGVSDVKVKIALLVSLSVLVSGCSSNPGPVQNSPTPENTSTPALETATTDPSPTLVNTEEKTEVSEEPDQVEAPELESEKMSGRMVDYIDGLPERDDLIGLVAY